MRRLTTLIAPLLCCACSSPMPATAQLPFEDDFERTALGANWYSNGGDWRLRNGYVWSTFSNNSPLFLNVDLPNNVTVEVDVYSDTTDVDAKVELMTDGRRHQSGYVFILGGWSNTISAIARLDEHGNDRQTKDPTEVSGKRWYRWKIQKQEGERDGKKGSLLTWAIDGEPYMEFFDPAPIHGKGHNRLGFGNWQNRIRFDNLKVYASP